MKLKEFGFLFSQFICQRGTISRSPEWIEIPLLTPNDSGWNVNPFWWSTYRFSWHINWLIKNPQSLSFILSSSVQIVHLLLYSSRSIEVIHLLLSFTSDVTFVTFVLGEMPSWRTHCYMTCFKAWIAFNMDSSLILRCFL